MGDLFHLIPKDTWEEHKASKSPYYPSTYQQAGPVGHCAVALQASRHCKDTRTFLVIYSLETYGTVKDHPDGHGLAQRTGVTSGRLHASHKGSSIPLRRGKQFLQGHNTMAVALSQD